MTVLPNRHGKKGIGPMSLIRSNPGELAHEERQVMMRSMEERADTNVAANVWESLLLVYRRIDVWFKASWWRRQRFVHELPDAEIADALRSFRAFPPLAAELSNGEALVTYDTVTIEDPICSVTPDENYMYWLSPGDIQNELDAFAPVGKYDSVFVLWPQQDLMSGTQIPSRGWGFGLGPGAFTNEATFAVVANAPSWAWNIPIVGEVWLHEWLHGVCAVFEQRGFRMPKYDADAGGSHGYVQCSSTGWTAFYRDLMTGRVLEDGICTGITKDAWRSRRRRMESTRAV
jgi:hypothetical protein